MIDDYCKCHCVKLSKYGVLSGPCFHAFGLNTERYGVSTEKENSVFAGNFSGSALNTNRAKSDPMFPRLNYDIGIPL